MFTHSTRLLSSTLRTRTLGSSITKTARQSPTSISARMASTALPATMKSLLQASRESHEVILTTLPVPTPTHPQDVLVKVHAASPCKGELTWAVNFPDAIPRD